MHKTCFWYQHRWFLCYLTANIERDLWLQILSPAPNDVSSRRQILYPWHSSGACRFFFRLRAVGSWLISGNPRDSLTVLTSVRSAERKEEKWRPPSIDTTCKFLWFWSLCLCLPPGCALVWQLVGRRDSPPAVGTRHDDMTWRFKFADRLRGRFRWWCGTRPAGQTQSRQSDSSRGGSVSAVDSGLSLISQLCVIFEPLLVLSLKLPVLWMGSLTGSAGAPLRVITQRSHTVHGATAPAAGGCVRDYGGSCGLDPDLVNWFLYDRQTSSPGEPVLRLFASLLLHLGSLQFCSYPVLSSASSSKPTTLVSSFTTSWTSSWSPCW